MRKDEFLKAAGLAPALADRWYDAVERALMEFDIARPQRAAAFIAQVGHESGGFVYTREIWGPTAAQQRYEGRSDLGNVMPGDGFRYRGRGLLQITGRINYAALAAALDVDVLARPELLENEVLAARSAAWWWQSHDCNRYADTGDFENLTRRINGGVNGLQDRYARWAVAKTALGA